MFFSLSFNKTNGPVSFFLPYLVGGSGFLVNIVLLKFAAIHKKERYSVLGNYNWVCLCLLSA